MLSLISDSVEPHHKIKRMNDYAQLIITKNIEKISGIMYLATNNEENQEVLDLVDHWSKCLCIEDFLHGSPAMDNGFRNRPVFSPEDFMVIYNAGTGFIDQKSLQKLCKKFSQSLYPAICNKFTYLRGDTRHTDILTAYLSAVLTLQLFVLHHGTRRPLCTRCLASHGQDTGWKQNTTRMWSHRTLSTSRLTEWWRGLRVAR